MSKNRQGDFDSCFADVTAGLQRVNVSNPGGIDLETDLALSVLCFSLASSSACFLSLRLPTK